MRRVMVRFFTEVLTEFIHNNRIIKSLVAAVFTLLLLPAFVVIASGNISYAAETGEAGGIVVLSENASPSVSGVAAQTETSPSVTGQAADLINPSDAVSGDSANLYDGWITVTGSSVAVNRMSATVYILDDINRGEAVFQTNMDLTGAALACSSSAASMDIVIGRTNGRSDAFSLYTYNTGKTTVTVTLNGVSFDVSLTVVKAPVNYSSRVLDLGKSFRLKIAKYPGKPDWKSTKPSVASVDGNGRISAKKVGNAIIYADIDGYRTGCVVSVVKKGITAVVKRARYIGTNWKYSQPRRMSSGFYDCSSLVWKAYRLSGRYVCGSRYNAPVAADIGRWCININRRLGKYDKSNIQKLKYLPGDILLKVHMRWDRFMGIGHIEMITGYSLHGFIGEQPVLFLTWGAREEGYGASRKDDFVCRPYN